MSHSSSWSFVCHMCEGCLVNDRNEGAFFANQSPFLNYRNEGEVFANQSPFFNIQKLIFGFWYIGYVYERVEVAVPNSARSQRS
jgi:hypothetical protein